MSRQILLPDAVAAQHRDDRARHRPRRNWSRAGRRYCIGCGESWGRRGCTARREADYYFRTHGGHRLATATPIMPDNSVAVVDQPDVTTESEQTVPARRAVIA